MDRRFLPTPLLNAVLVVVYLAAGRLGLALASINPSASAVWPPTGIAIAALLLFGSRLWPGVLVGAFLVNVTTSGSVPASILIAIGNTLEGIVAVYLVNRLARGRRAFELAQDIFLFTLLAGLFSPMVSATIGVTTLVLTGLATGSNYGPIWLTWWLGDATGALIVTPFIVLWAARPRLETKRARVLEAAALIVAAIVLGAVAFGDLSPFSASNYELEYIITPLIVWAAFRFGQTGSATATVLLSSIAVWGTLNGFGPFGRKPENIALPLLQGFMGVVSITGLALAAVVARRKQAEEKLEQRVQERTAQLLASNTQLQSEVAERQQAQHQLEESQSRLRQLSAHVQAAREEERASAALEIHDELGQQLTALKMDAARLVKTLDQRTADELREGLRALSEELDNTIGVVRRIATNLRPAILDDFGLPAAMQWQLQEFQRRTGIKARFKTNVDSVELKPESAIALFRLCQEALTNVARHAQATEVVVSLDVFPDGLIVQIADNGRGIGTGQLKDRPSLGLLGMRERVHLLRGTLDISGTAGHGTTVRAQVPLP